MVIRLKYANAQLQIRMALNLEFILILKKHKLCYNFRMKFVEVTCAQERHL
jgi:hypothetical protein